MENTEPKRIWIEENGVRRPRWEHAACSMCGYPYQSVRKDCTYCGQTCRNAASYERQIIAKEKKEAQGDESVSDSCL